MNDYPRCLVLAVIAITSVSCRSAETDPNRLGWWDLVGPGYSRLQQELEEDRSQLEEREQTLDSLQGVVSAQHSEITKLTSDLKTVSIQHAGLQATRRRVLQEINQKRHELEECQRSLKRRQAVRDSIPTRDEIDHVLQLQQDLHLLSKTVEEILLIVHKES